MRAHFTISDGVNIDFVTMQIDPFPNDILTGITFNLATCSTFFFFPVAISSYYRETDPALKAKKKIDVMTRVYPFYLSKLEDLAKNNGGYLHGNQVVIHLS